MEFMELDSRTVATRFGLTSLRDAGTGSGAIMFLHGLSGSSSNWGWQFGHFAASWRCLAWDAPGYGHSVVGDTDINSYAARVVSLLDALDVESAVIVGHSMGGVVAGRVAGRYPDRVSGILLSCTHTGYAMSPGEGFTPGHRQRLDEVDRLSAREYGLARAQNMLAPGASTDVVDRVADIAGMTTRAGLESAITCILEADNTDIVSHLSMPVTVLAGEHDTIAPAEKTSRLASLIPNARRVIVPEAAHAPYLEKPAAFNQVLTDLLQGVAN